MLQRAFYICWRQSPLSTTLGLRRPTGGGQRAARRRPTGAGRRPTRSSIGRRRMRSQQRTRSPGTRGRGDARPSTSDGRGRGLRTSPSARRRRAPTPAAHITQSTGWYGAAARAGVAGVEWVADAAWPWLRRGAAAVGIHDSVAAAVLAGAMVVRLAVIAGGIISDAAGYPYSDVDYTVLTDAARHMAAGGSPYERATYRYTPLLAAASLPNLVWPPAGKVLMSAIDGALGVGCVHLLTPRGVSQRAAAAAAAAYLWNPLSIVASTRGSADSLVVGVVIASLVALQRHAVDLAAAAVGLAVHLKLYPVLYLIPILVFLDVDAYAPLPPQTRAADACVRALGTPLAAAAHSALRLVGAPVAARRAASPTRLGFAAVAGCTFAILAAACTALYGADFIRHTYLYHATRVDTRHNFSAYFLPLYLQPPGSGTVAHGLAALVPQVGGACLLGALAARDLPFALLLQTAYFVAWNKVITAQYFVWYLGLVPLVLPQSTLAAGWRHPRRAALGAALAAGWLLFEVGWNAPAYLLEVQGQAAFVPVWCASLLFFLANVAVLSATIATHTFRPWFRHGAPTSVADLLAAS